MKRDLEDDMQKNVEMIRYKNVMYNQTKKKMEKYQRNIFGFSSEVVFCSFENILPILILVVFGFIVIGFIVTKSIEINSQRLDVLKSIRTVANYKDIGKIDIVKETVLMPVIEIKVKNVENIQQFGIFTNMNTSNGNQNVWDNEYKINFNKLNRFINIVMNVNNKTNGISRYLQRSFRKCQYQDFSKRQYHTIDRQRVKHMLCPDTQFLENKMFLGNSYSAKSNRQSFELLIVKCSKDSWMDDCATENQISLLLKELVFNIYFVHRNVNLKAKIDQEPFRVSFSFFQQFVLGIDSYRDCNIFVTQNQVKYQSSRLGVLETQNQNFYKLKPKSIWYSMNPQFSNMFVSWDGENYKSARLQVLGGLYFFLSNEVVIHDRQLFTFSMFLGQLGGILGLIVSVMKFIVEPIKFNFDLAKIIQIIYLKKKNRNVGQIEKYLDGRSQNDDQNYPPIQLIQNKCSIEQTIQQTDDHKQQQQQKQINNNYLDINNLQQQQQYVDLNHKKEGVHHNENLDNQQLTQQLQNIDKQDQNESLARSRTDQQPSFRRRVNILRNKLQQIMINSVQNLKSKQHIGGVKKLAQINTQQNIDVGVELDQLEFKTLDVLNDIVFMKPLFMLFKRTRLVKNYETYNTLKQDLLEKLQIQKIVGLIIKQHRIVKHISTIDNQIDQLMKVNQYQAIKSATEQSSIFLDTGEDKNLDIKVNQQNRFQDIGSFYDSQADDENANFKINDIRLNTSKFIQNR